MSERREVENENLEIIRATNQLQIDSQNYVNNLALADAKITLGLIDTIKNANDIRLKTEKLKDIKCKASSIKNDVNELFHKLHVQLKLKNVTALKKNALSAKIKIKLLEKDTSSLEESLNDLKQSNDKERKDFAEAALENLNNLSSSLSCLANIVEERDNLKLESFRFLTECLENMRTANDEMISSIYKIPDYSNENVFTKKCTEYISTMSNRDMLRNIESVSIQDGSVVGEEYTGSLL